VKQYEIWWIDLPDPVGSRPVLILTRTSALGFLGRALVAEVTTTVRDIPQELSLGPREGLPRRCVANLDAVRSAPIERLRSRIGALHASRHAEVKRAMGHVLAWPELTALP
jgi:mRNA interferase MazF